MPTSTLALPPRPRHSMMGALALCTTVFLASAMMPLSAGAQGAGCATVEAVYPGAEWEAVPDAGCAGWSVAGLEAVRGHLSGMSTTGFMAVVGGRTLLEYGDLERVSYLASVRKSILSMLYGIHVERDDIDLDETLEELGIDDVGGLTDAERQATTRHLLMARSGVYHEASNGGDDLDSAPERGSKAPGEYYLYSNWDFNALGSIFEQEVGKSIYDALRDELAIPLGMREFDRSRHRRTGDATRSEHLAYHMHLSTRDMARVGYLMLREGRWNDRQIVPGDWVEESTSALTRRSEMNPENLKSGAFGYGYLWWVIRRP